MDSRRRAASRTSATLRTSIVLHPEQALLMCKALTYSVGMRRGKVLLQTVHYFLTLCIDP